MKVELLKLESRRFFTALMFLTRIPCPKWVGYSDELLNESIRYFPLVGVVIGSAAAVIFSISSHFFSGSLAATLSVVATILLTGGFHEDGFADACDGFGGGWSKEQILTIMKDSRLGTYGTLGLCLILLIKIQALADFSNITATLALISGHALSRFSAVSLIGTMNYVQDIDRSKSKPIATRCSPTSKLIAASIGLGTALICAPIVTLMALPIFYGGRLYILRYFERRLGGYTGDCLGAVQQLSETIWYLLIIATS